MTAGPAEWAALIAAVLMSLRFGMLALFLVSAAVLIAGRQIIG
jgi:uncharacterized membrane protein